MSKSIIHKLYGGDHIPHELMGSSTDEYKATIRKIETERNYLAEKLPGGDVERLERMESLFGDAMDMDAQRGFCIGFKMAALIMCEVFMPEITE